jgi:trypsin
MRGKAWGRYGKVMVAVACFAFGASGAAHAVPSQTDGGQPEVVGGTPADPGEYPHQVAILINGLPGIPLRSLVCGGSLVSPDTVLTAAHCVTEFVASGPNLQDIAFRAVPPTLIDVLVDTHDLGAGGGGQRLHVRRIRAQPEFLATAGASGGDVAVLQLAGNATSAPVDIVTPGQESLWAPGTDATVTGWGETDDDPVTPLLQEATIPIVSDSDCATAYGSDFDPSKMLCAGNLETGGEGACFGDSGGALVVDNGGDPLEVGVVLGGDFCGAPELPDVYTRLAPFSSFVNPYLDPDTPPGRPGSVRVISAYGITRLSWKPPFFDGGTIITGYRIRVQPGTQVLNTGRLARSRDFRGLVRGRIYTFSIQTVNAIGAGVARTVSIRIP